MRYLPSSTIVTEFRTSSPFTDFRNWCKAVFISLAVKVWGNLRIITPWCFSGG